MKLIYCRHNKTKFASKISKQQIHFCELTIVVDGCLDYTVDGNPIHLENNQAVFIPADSYRERPVPEKLAEYYSFNFICKPEETPDLPTFIPDFLGKNAEYLLRYLDTMLRKAITSNNELVLHLMQCLIDQYKLNRQKLNYSEPVVKVINYLRKNLSNKITLADVADASYYSVSYIEDLFRRELNTSVINYLLGLRIEEAKHILIDGDRRIAEVAELCGFSDANYFTRVFRAREGVTPVQYRKKWTDR